MRPFVPSSSRHPAAPGAPLAPGAALPLWGTLRLLLATYPTEPTQVQLGVWSVLWGLIVLTPLSHTFGLAPHAYAWMRPVPAGAWGLAWAAKGAWQIHAALTLTRARIFWLPGLGRAQAQCLLAARVNVNLAVALAAGFAWYLGPLNVYVAFYAYQAALQGWVLRRAAQDALAVQLGAALARQGGTLVREGGALAPEGGALAPEGGAPCPP